nr:hypothetical protein [Butyrivibrio sp.]
STAIADEGYEFVNWTSDETVVSEEASFVPSDVTESVTYIANFKKEEVVEQEFNQSTVRDGIEISLYAVKGVLPADAELRVEKVNATLEDNIKETLDDQTDENAEVKETMSYDIKIFSQTEKDKNPDSDGFVQPADGTVSVRFSQIEVSEITSEDETAEVEVYHIEENGNEVANVENMDAITSTDNSEASFDTEHFSIYTISVIVKHDKWRIWFGKEEDLLKYKFEIVDTNGESLKDSTGREIVVKDDGFTLNFSKTSDGEYQEQVISAYVPKIDGYAFKKAEYNNNTVTKIRVYIKYEWGKWWFLPYPKGYNALAKLVNDNDGVLDYDYNNSIKLIYEPTSKAVSYTVNYYKNGNIVDADSKTVNTTIKSNETNITVDSSVVSKEKYSGYSFKEVYVNKNKVEDIPATVNNGDVIDIYYIQNLNYSVNVYLESIADNGYKKSDTAVSESAYYGDEIKKSDIIDAVKDSIDKSKYELKAVKLVDGENEKAFDTETIKLEDNTEINVYYDLTFKESSTKCEAYLLLPEQIIGAKNINGILNSEYTLSAGYTGQGTSYYTPCVGTFVLSQNIIDFGGNNKHCSYTDLGSDDAPVENHLGTYTPNAYVSVINGKQVVTYTDKHGKIYQTLFDDIDWYVIKHQSNGWHVDGKADNWECVSKEVSYKVNYYMDGILKSSDTVKKQVLNSATTVSVDKDSINCTDKFAAAKFSEIKIADNNYEEINNIPSEVSFGTEINVYYLSKLSYKVKIHTQTSVISDTEYSDYGEVITVSDNVYYGDEVVTSTVSNIASVKAITDGLATRYDFSKITVGSVEATDFTVTDNNTVINIYYNLKTATITLDPNGGTVNGHGQSVNESDYYKDLGVKYKVNDNEVTLTYSLASNSFDITGATNGDKEFVGWKEYNAETGKLTGTYKKEFSYVPAESGLKDITYKATYRTDSTKARYFLLLPSQANSYASSIPGNEITSKDSLKSPSTSYFTSPYLGTSSISEYILENFRSYAEADQDGVQVEDELGEFTPNTDSNTIVKDGVVTYIANNRVYQTLLENIDWYVIKRESSDGWHVDGMSTKWVDVTPGVSLSAKGNEQNYDGNAHSIKVTADSDASLTYAVYNPETKTYDAEQNTNPSFTDVGTYTVRVTSVTTKEVNGKQCTYTQQAQADVIINPLNIKVQSISAEKTYDGTPLTRNDP